MKLTMLGTGNAMVTGCYNTCFLLRDGERALLVDGGGGNLILQRLKAADCPVSQIGEIFVTHKHIDHILGIIWVIRAAAQAMNQGLGPERLLIYSHEEVIGLLKTMAGALLQAKQTRLIGERILLLPLADGEKFRLLGRPAQAFDIRSTKAKQFGFTLEYAPGRTLACCGDEPYSDCEEKYVRGSVWLLHEAFCLAGEAALFRPYEKHHSTVKDACEAAEKLGVQNLLLYHTEEKNLKNRKALYVAEGRPYFSGKIYVPEDLETIEVLP